jgi:hypothetical protein
MSDRGSPGARRACPPSAVLSTSVDPEAIKRAQARIDQAASGRMEPAQLDAVLERARDQVEALAATAAEIESTLPSRVGDAVQDGLRAQVLPVGRNLAEIRGLMNQLIRRLERLEGDLLAERHARVDDLALLVDLVTSGWRNVEHRLARIEGRLSSDDAIPERAEPGLRREDELEATAPTGLGLEVDPSAERDRQLTRDREAEARPAAVA